MPLQLLQVGLCSFDKQEVVISHQAVGVQSPALLADFAAEQIEKRCAVRIIAKNILARISTRCNVIQRAGEFQTQRTGHVAMLIRLTYKVKR